MLTQELSTQVENFVTRFDQIGHERIEGLPIYNSELNVEAIDFQVCPDGLLGVLITPWFINLILIPAEQTRWQAYELGTKHTCDTGNGEQEFVLGEDEGVGWYLFKTVISPTHCLKNQAAAQTTARQALHDLLTPVEDELIEEETSAQVELSTEMKKNMGRRDFMRKLVPDI